MFRFLIVGVLLCATTQLAFSDDHDICEKLKEVGGWTDVENWVWDEICAGLPADLSQRDVEDGGGSLDPSNKPIWKAKESHRTITSRFLHDVLFKKPFRDQIPSDGVSLYGAYFPDYVDLSNGHLLWPLRIANSRFEAGLSMASIRADSFVSVEGSYARKLNFADARINGSLMLGEGAPFSTVFEHASVERARIGGQLSIVTTGTQQINDLSYHLIPKLVIPGDGDGLLPAPDPPPTAVVLFNLLIDLLSPSNHHIDWLDNMPGSSYQPYAMLASTFRASGDIGAANHVLFKGRVRQRKESSRSGQWILMCILEVSVGYAIGGKTFRVLIWVGILIFVGWFVVCRAQRKCGCVISKGGRLGFWFSVDYLVPLLQLDDRFREVRLLCPGAKRYFYFHQVMGYLLVFFLIAGLSTIPSG